MKIAELRAKTKQELESMLGEVLRNLLGLRFKKALHEVKDTSVIRKNRKMVARIKTVICEKQSVA